jgi:hypothetical protein
MNCKNTLTKCGWQKHRIHHDHIRPFSPECPTDRSQILVPSPTHFSRFSGRFCFFDAFDVYHGFNGVKKWINGDNPGCWPACIHRIPFSNINGLDQSNWESDSWCQSHSCGHWRERNETQGFCSEIAWSEFIEKNISCCLNMRSVNHWKFPYNLRFPRNTNVRIENSLWQERSTSMINANFLQISHAIVQSLKEVVFWMNPLNDNLNGRSWESPAFSPPEGIGCLSPRDILLFNVQTEAGSNCPGVLTMYW